MPRDGWFQAFCSLVAVACGFRRETPRLSILLASVSYGILSVSIVPPWRIAHQGLLGSAQPPEQVFQPCT